MRSTYKPLGEFLVEQGIITRTQLEDALAMQRKYYLPARPAEAGAAVSGEESQLNAVARMMGVDVWLNDKDAPSRDALALLPAHLCRSEQLLPIKLEGGQLLLAMADPGDLDTIDRVEKLTRLRIKPLLASRIALTQSLDHFYPVVRVDSLVDQLADQAINIAPAGVDGADATVITPVAEARPVVAIVNKILSEAMRTRASDVHIEPQRDKIDVRFRIDGQLHRAYELPSQLLQGIVARIKIMGEMDIVEYRLPQDGHLTFPYDNRNIDVRIGVIPSHHGQRIVMRVLDTAMTLRTMGELGFNDRNLELFKDMISKPWGLVIVTGPTGSGKTTSLYAAVNQLKEHSRNIMTCEDPVEYEIAGISQSSVSDKLGLNMATLLRALMRQDPDIILVGEIRDKETAETAIRAALTGHLVLSTMHSNDAVSAIPRLLDMGIEPLLLSSALIGVTAQRLVRVLCTECRDQSPTSPEENVIFRAVYGDPVDSSWRSVGCKACGGTGFRGRTGVHEVLPLTPEIQRLIQVGVPPDELKNFSSVYGYRPMQEDACDRVIAGHTTLREVQRNIYFDTMATKVKQQGTPGEPPQLRIAAA
jgi:type IV pilus assembly protein PilB